MGQRGGTGLNQRVANSLSAKKILDLPSLQPSPVVLLPPETWQAWSQFPQTPQNSHKKIFLWERELLGNKGMDNVIIYNDII